MSVVLSQGIEYCDRMSDTGVKVRCSAWAREVDLSPIATVGVYTGYLLVKVPLPWPKDVGEVTELAAIGDRLRDRNLRLQALVPSDADDPQSGRRLILYTSGDGSFSRFERYETRTDDALDSAVDRLFQMADSRSEHPERDEVDLLVCTHGRRDVCCGSLGTELALGLAATLERPGTNLWRTSHTGGHRFAPTFILLPQGTAWAFAGIDIVLNVIERSVPFAEVSGHYRGCAGLSGPHAQVLEREVLKMVGWELLDRPRMGFLTGELTSDGGEVARLESGADRWEGVVRRGRTLPVPDCMKPLGESKKSETEWTVSDVRAVH